MGQQVGFPVLEAEHPALGRLAPAPSHPQPHQGATGSGQEMILRPQSSPGNVGNGKAKLSPRGKSRGRHRGKGVARQRWGLGPELWGHTGCLLRRGTDTGQAPHHTIPGADRVARNTHTHTHTHARTHTFPYQPDNLVLKSGSSSESQPSPQPVGFRSR